MLNKIIVNATAIRSGGSLTILNQFLFTLKEINLNDKYFIFISDKITPPKIDNVVFIKKNTEKWLVRILWDFRGVKRWCKKNKITPDLIISLQSTGVRFKGVNQLIYFHHQYQNFNYQFSFTKKFEFKMWLLQKFYPYFMRLNTSSKTYFIAQLPFVKRSLVSLLNHDEDRVFVVRPNSIVNTKGIKLTKLDSDKTCTHFFYPAMPFRYKNHIIIIKALIYLKNHYLQNIEKIKIHFTHKNQMSKEIVKLIQKENLEPYLVMNDKLDYSTVINYYNSIDALIFPSKMESFGLPLTEAAQFGLPILAANLSYAHEVLENYEGVTFIDTDNPIDWANAILKLSKNKIKFKPKNFSTENNWINFFDIVNKILDKKL